MNKNSVNELNYCNKTIMTLNDQNKNIITKKYNNIK